MSKLVGETTKRDNPDLVSRLRERILATSPGAIAQALSGLGAREDSTATLGHIRVPTLVVVGEEDVLTPPSEAEKMAAATKKEAILEAALELDRTKSGFLVFRDATSERVNVIYRRKDNNYGLIAPEG